MSAYFIQSGTVFDCQTSWTPNMDDFLKLSKSDLTSLIPRSCSLPTKATKTQIGTLLMERWQEVVKDRSMLVVSGSGGSDEPGQERDHDNDKGDDSEDPEDPDEPSDEPSDEEDFPNLEDMIDITVRKNFDRGTFVKTMMCKVHPSWRTSSLSFMVYQEWHIRPSSQRLLYENNEISLDLTFEENHIGHGSELDLRMTLCGGVAGVRKTFLKRDQALVQLKKTQTEKFMTPDELDISNNLLPESFTTFITEEQSKVSELLALKIRLGSNFTKSCLRHLDTDTVNVVRQIFTSNRVRKERHMSSEEKVLKMLPLLFPHLQRLENCSNKLAHVQNRIQLDLLHHFSEEFGSYSEAQGRTTLDVQPFVKMLDAEFELRSNHVVASNQDAIAGNCSLQ